VGRDFPVFLHPQSNEEHALARTERKQGAGHQGFAVHASPEVTLEEDLLRRDLTINAIAQREDGELIDPYGGVADLHARVLRHVSPAFEEDPLRVFRVARFAARFAPLGFRVADETLALMARMAASGELATLSAERVWAELAKVLEVRGGAVFVDVLRRTGALEPWLVEWTTREPAADLLDASGPDDWTLARRFALFCAALPEADAVLAGRRLKAPKPCQELARLCCAEGAALARWRQLPPPELLDLLQRCDALRRQDRFAALCEVRVALGDHECADAPALAGRLARLPLALPSGGVGSADIAAQVRRQRIAALTEWPR
jgi:tRNA nucleotidyltransferase (CCA-adding enzyme)